MIAELSVAMAAIKETAGLAKVINDAKTDAEVKAATIELQNKLITLQAECFSLGDAIRLRDEEVMHLKAKIAEFEDFCAKVEGYVLEQLDSGAFVYSKNDCEWKRNNCASVPTLLFQKYKIDTSSASSR